MIIAIATLNEAETIGSLVQSFTSADWDVVVVDGGSTDQTCIEAVQAGAKIFINRTGGIGPCLMSAWQYALRAGYPGLLQVGAGGKYNPYDYLRFLHPIERGTDVIIGSRFTRGSHYYGNWWTTLRDRGMTLACNRSLGSRYTDWTSNYRYFGRRALEFLLPHRYTTTMRGWHVEVLAAAYRAGLTIEEVPVSYAPNPIYQGVLSDMVRAWWSAARK